MTTSNSPYGGDNSISFFDTSNPAFKLPSPPRNIQSIRIDDKNPTMSDQMDIV